MKLNLKILIFSFFFFILFNVNFNKITFGLVSHQQIIQYLNLVIYGFTFYKIYIYYKYSDLKIKTVNLAWLILFLYIGMLSFLFSQQSIYALYQLMQLVLTFLFAYVAYRELDSHELQKVMLVSSTAIILLSYVLLCYRSLGWQYLGGEPNAIGIFSHKNSLGEFTSFAILLAVFYMNRKFRIYMIGLCSILLLLSKSYTSILCLAAAVALLCLLNYIGIKSLYIRSIAYIAAAFVILVLFILAGSGLFERFLLMINKDITFSGRTNIWVYLLEMLQERNFRGFGYSVFWNFNNMEKSLIIDNVAIVSTINQAHNGYIDLLINGDMVVFIYYIAMILFLLVNAVKNRNHFISAFILYFLFRNFFESSFLENNSLFTVILFLYSMDLNQCKLFEGSGSFVVPKKNRIMMNGEQPLMNE